jgi:hypothetical protein
LLHEFAAAKRLSVWPAASQTRAARDRDHRRRFIFESAFINAKTSKKRLGP